MAPLSLRCASRCVFALALFGCRGPRADGSSAPAAGGRDDAWEAPGPGEKWWTRRSACPKPATLKGAAPPDGTRVWCERDDGSYDGPSTTFYADGVRRSDANYREGRMHGPWRQFYPDGRPRSEGEYADGRDVGLWRSYHDNGKLATEARHADDGTVAFVAYAQSGAKEREGKFVDGLEQGEWTVWGADGKPQTVTYEKGRIVATAETSRWAIGIPDCDEYLVRYTRCIEAKVPDAARPQLRDAMEQTAKAWKEASLGPAKDGLASACRAALDAAKQATASMGCEW